MIARILMYCLVVSYLLAALATQSLRPSGATAWWWLSGFLLAASLVPVILWGPRRGIMRFFVFWSLLMGVGSLSLWIEALIFLKASPAQQLQDLWAPIVLFTVFALLLTLLMRPFGLSSAQPASGAPLAPAANRSRIGMALVAGPLAYLALYYVFGALFFRLFTHSFYQNPSLPLRVDMVTRLGLWFPVIEFGRGLLMAVAALPFVFFVRMRRWPTAVSLAAMFWVVGGLAPLLLPNAFMPLRLRAFHILEIFTQNAAFGLVLGLLLTSGRQRFTAPHAHSGGA